LNPASADALSLLGNNLILSGRVDQGLPLVHKAMVLNPRYPSWYNYALSCAYYLRGEYEEALTAALKLDWGNYIDYTYRLTAYAQLGRLEEAKRELDTVNELDPQMIPEIWERFRAYNFPDESIHAFLEGFRKAGAQLPDDPALTQ
jgi:tetratricopeptide (TPR) repeat protein